MVKLSFSVGKRPSWTAWAYSVTAAVIAWSPLSTWTFAGLPPPFSLSTALAIRPGSIEELAEVKGVGPAKLERYGEEIVRLLAGAVAAT